MPEPKSINFSEIIDISTPLHEHTLVYPGDPAFRKTKTHEIDEDGHGYNLTSIEMSAHLGTHVDAPIHFIQNGKFVHEIPADRWITKAVVISTGEDSVIEPRHLNGVTLEAGISVLFRTTNCYALARGKYLENFCALTMETAQLLAEKKINLIGIDWLSIEKYDDPSFPIHRFLLSNDVIILEGLQLHHIEPGEYTLILSPLYIMDSDGAPTRAMLLR